MVRTPIQSAIASFVTFNLCIFFKHIFVKYQERDTRLSQYDERIYSVFVSILLLLTGNKDVFVQKGSFRHGEDGFGICIPLVELSTCWKKGLVPQRRFAQQIRVMSTHMRGYL